MGVITLMEGRIDVLLDTNILIGLFNGNLLFDRVIKEMTCGISAVTIMETFALAGISDNEEYHIEQYVASLFTVPVNDRIARRASLLGRTRSSKKRLDILIAATALELDVPLLTLNQKDFRAIPGIRLMPFEGEDS